MATLNQISDNIAGRLSQPFNNELKERLKDSFRFIYAERVRQRVAKENIKDRYKTSYDATLSKVDSVDSCVLSTGCYVLRTDFKIPKTVDFNSDVPFTYVGTLLGKPFMYCRPVEISFVSSLPLNKHIIFYTLRNDYIYIYNNLNINTIRIESIFSNPEEVINMCTNGNCYNDDYEFPVPEDMIESIILEILNTYAKLPIDDESISINNDIK